MGTDESTDEILSRLLKEHEARITYKLLTEDFLGNNEFNGEDDNDDLPETLRLRYKVRKLYLYLRRMLYFINVIRNIDMKIFELRSLFEIYSEFKNVECFIKRTS